MEGGQSGPYLRLTRASAGPRVSVAKTYRDENETLKKNISAQTQRPSSAVEYKKLTIKIRLEHQKLWKCNYMCILALNVRY